MFAARTGICYNGGGKAAARGGDRARETLVTGSLERRTKIAGGLIAIAILAALIALLVWRADAGDTRPARGAGGGRTIAEENELPGTKDWQITKPSLNGEIQAYAGEVSVNRGGTLDLYVSTKESGTRYQAQIFRMGWYGGDGARIVRSIENLEGEHQGWWDPLGGLQECPSCTIDPETLLIAANWKRSLQIKIGDDWVSGYYLVRFHEMEHDTSTYAIFIVRDDASDAPALVQASTNTWQAYNTWGDASLYGSFGANRQYVAKSRRAYRVSYDRPYDPTLRNGKNYGAGEFFGWEYNFVRWAESKGFEMAYTTSVDVSLRPELLQQHRMFISLGHDEYWTKQQRDGVEAARDAGTNLAFIGGNDVYWQSRLEPSPGTGAAARVLTVYKDAALDPVAKTDPKQTTVLFASPPVSRPQSLLTGVAYGSNTTPDYQPWVAFDTSAWPFDGTEIRENESFPGIIGYEYDHPAPADERPAGLTVLGHSPAHGFIGDDTSDSTLYTAESGAQVFAAGTVAWAWGLDDFGHEDRGAFANEKLQRLTQNIIERMSAPAQNAVAP